MFFLNLIYKLKLTQSEEFNFVCCSVIGVIITMLLYYIAVRSMCSCYCVHLLFSSRKLGFIDKSIKLLSLLQTIHLESKYERKSKMRQWILNKIISFFFRLPF